jgi:hypothetical protein
MSVLFTDRQSLLPGNYFCQSLSRPKARSAVGGLHKFKDPLTPSRAEFGTFRLATQCLTLMRYGVSP